MAWKSTALGAVLWAALAVPSWASPGASPAPALQQMSVDAGSAAQWIVRNRDHRGWPFAIVDKKTAHLYVFDAAGRLIGASAVLLGQTPGDESAPEVGKHATQGFVPLSERTTPAGRFVTHPGTNLSGEHIVWVDYESAFAIHRLRPGASYAAREKRLGSGRTSDHRVSLGCVIAPVAFYTSVVEPVLGRARSIVYVLPESGQLRDLFNAM